MKKAIGYVRVSTLAQAQEGVSLAAQAERIGEWCHLNGYELGKVYSDDGISGGRLDNRPGLNTAFSALKKGNALVIYSLSRVSRSTRDSLDIADLVVKKGCDLISLTEKIDSTGASGKLIFRVMASFNEYERDVISERTRVALAHKRSEGFKLGGILPEFGYDVDAQGMLVPNSHEQQAIQDIQHLREQGFSYRRICRALEEKGVEPKQKGTRWHPEKIKRILQRAA